MSKLIPILSDRCLVVELPEGANRFTVFNDDRPYLSFFVNAETPRVYLPEGNWRIIGTLSEVTETEALELVDYFTTDEDFGKEDVFRDYKGEAFYDTALESFHSAIEAAGHLISNPHGKNQDVYNKGSKDYWKWIIAQQKVLLGDRTLILERI